MSTEVARRNQTTLGIVVAAIAVVIALGSAAFALTERTLATNDAVSTQKRTWHAVICSIESQTIQNPKTPYTQKVLTVQFFDGLLVHNIQTAPCGFTVPAKG